MGNLNKTPMVMVGAALLLLAASAFAADQGTVPAADRTETLPTLQEHLSMAKDLQGKVMAPAGAASRRGSKS